MVVTRRFSIVKKYWKILGAIVLSIVLLISTGILAVPVICKPVIIEHLPLHFDIAVMSRLSMETCYHPLQADFWDGIFAENGSFELKETAIIPLKPFFNKTKERIAEIFQSTVSLPVVIEIREIASLSLGATKKIILLDWNGAKRVLEESYVLEVPTEDIKDLLAEATDGRVLENVRLNTEIENGWASYRFEDTQVFVTDDWQDFQYESLESVAGFKIEYPNRWRRQSSVFYEGESKIAEFSPPALVKLKDGQHCYDNYAALPSLDYGTYAEIIDKGSITYQSREMRMLHLSVRGKSVYQYCVEKGGFALSVAFYGNAQLEDDVFKDVMSLSEIVPVE